MTGIYSITNILNNKKYMGSSANITRRFGEHKSDLKCGVHANSFLQNSYNLHGKDNFIYEILEECAKENLIEREEFWIAKFNTSNDQFGYNFSPFPRRPKLGRKALPETLKKMSIANSGENHPMFGRKHSQEHLLNLSKAIKGIKKPTSGRKKEYKIISPIGEKISFLGLRKFCRDHNLSLGSIKRVVDGVQAEHQGWKSIFNVISRPDAMKPKVKVLAICNNKEYLFNSMLEAQKSEIFDNPPMANNITNCCKGKIKSCGKVEGFPVYWKYV